MQHGLPTLSQAFDSIEAAFASHQAEDESLLTVTTTHTFANTWLKVGSPALDQGCSTGCRL